MKIPIFVGISDGSIKTVLAQTSIEGRDKIKERSKNLGYGEYLEIRATWSHGYHSWLTETWIPGKYTISVVKLKKIT
ncbi:MAG: hypothetical protein H6791_01455 [Candidatus Nomurabacteria bacterium]|nr:MAG: hypothetical protein H6791_01455 [Candidatus Nomurabacteria bacterium]